MGNGLSETTDQPLTDRPESPGFLGAVASRHEIPGFQAEILWRRFQQLGGTLDGVLDAALFDDPPFSDDYFLQLLIKQLPQHFKGTSSIRHTKEGLPERFIIFEDFALLAWAWAKKGTEGRLQCIFQVLSGPSRQLDSSSVMNALKALLQSDDEETIRKKAQSFIGRIDSKGLGFISEDDFVGWVRSMPAMDVDILMGVNIVL